MTSFRASPEAQTTWLRVVSVLRAYWSHGRRWDALPTGSWWADTRVQGGEHDPMEPLIFAVGADKAMNDLRRRAPKAYVIACRDIEEPHRSYHTERGTGVADLLGLTTPRALELLEMAKHFVWALLEDREIDEALRLE